MSNYTSLIAGSTTALLARLLDADDVALDPADVSAAQYTIYEVDETDGSLGDAVTGHDEIALQVAGVMFDEMQTGSAWVKDNIGYNFRLEPDQVTAEPFPDSETTYLVRVTLTHDVIGDIDVDFYVTTYREQGGSYYCTRRDLYELFTSYNVEKWADLRGVGDVSEITSRIDWACRLATAWVNARLRHGPYELPFSTVDPLIIDAATRYAASLLYDSRGVQDTDTTTGEPVNLLAAHKRNAIATISKVLSGQLRLDATEVSASYPQAIEDD